MSYSAPNSFGRAELARDVAVERVAAQVAEHDRDAGLERLAVDAQADRDHAAHQVDGREEVLDRSGDPTGSARGARRGSVTAETAVAGRQCSHGHGRYGSRSARRIRQSCEAAALLADDVRLWRARRGLEAGDVLELLELAAGVRRLGERVDDGAVDLEAVLGGEAEHVRVVDRAGAARRLRPSCSAPRRCRVNLLAAIDMPMPVPQHRTPKAWVSPCTAAADELGRRQVVRRCGRRARRRSPTRARCVAVHREIGPLT